MASPTRRVTALLQAIIVVFSRSVALLGDTLHNVADALTAVPLLIAFRLGRRPPTKRYTYGYGRAEDLGGLVRHRDDHAVRRLRRRTRRSTGCCTRATSPTCGRSPPRPSSGSSATRSSPATGSASAVGSAAPHCVADGLHARTDGFTSLAVLLGAGGVALGWQRADPVVGLVITVAILGVLRSAVGQVGARLMDAVDPAWSTRPAAAVLGVDGHPGRARAADPLDRAHACAPRPTSPSPADLTVGQAHELAHHAEDHLLAKVGRLTAATVHASPSGAH